MCLFIQFLWSPFFRLRVFLGMVLGIILLLVFVLLIWELVVLVMMIVAMLLVENA
jgi:hypothetical protein